MFLKDFDNNPKLQLIVETSSLLPAFSDILAKTVQVLSEGSSFNISVSPPSQHLRVTNKTWSDIYQERRSYCSHWWPSIHSLPWEDPPRLSKLCLQLWRSPLILYSRTLWSHPSLKMSKIWIISNATHFSGIYFYISAIFICKSGTGVILPALMKVWKIPHKPRHGIHWDVFPVAEPSG